MELVLEYVVPVTEDFEFLTEARRRFQGERFESLYHAWRSGELGEHDLRVEFLRLRSARTVSSPNSLNDESRSIVFCPRTRPQVNVDKTMKRDHPETSVVASVGSECGKASLGNRLKQERNPMHLLRRHQQGYVYKTGKKVKTWYGMWREDVEKAEGGIDRRQKHLRLGTLSDLPTRAAALQELTRRMGDDKPRPVDMTFAELFERWKIALVPTIRNTTAVYYLKMLSAHIVPAFGEGNIQLIGRYDVEKFLAERASTCCRNTLRGMRVSLGRVLSWAVSCFRKILAPEQNCPGRGRRLFARF